MLEVLRCRSNRVLLLTSGHVALLRCTSKPADDTVMYKSKWNLRLNDVQNVRGELPSMPLQLQTCIMQCRPNISELLHATPCLAYAAFCEPQILCCYEAEPWPRY